MVTNLYSPGIRSFFGGSATPVKTKKRPLDTTSKTHTHSPASKKRALSGEHSPSSAEATLKIKSHTAVQKPEAKPKGKPPQLSSSSGKTVNQLVFPYRGSKANFEQQERIRFNKERALAKRAARQNAVQTGPSSSATATTCALGTFGKHMCSERNKLRKTLRKTLRVNFETSTGSSGSVSSRSSQASSSRGQRLGKGDGQVTNTVSSGSGGREAMLKAVELRQKDWRSGGSGTAEQRKAVLLGKIDAIYRSKGQESPIGLGMASVEKLKKHLRVLTS
jgi:hypothetical protein